MTIASEVMKTRFTGDGSTTAFDIAWKVPSSTSLSLYLVDNSTDPSTYAEITSNYSVSPTDGSYPSLGATITYPSSGSAIDSDHVFVVMRKLSLLQSLTLKFGGTWNPSYMEKALDNIVMEIQQANEMASRAIRVPRPVDTDAISPLLPYPQSNTVIGWKSDLSGLENVDIQSKIDTATAAAEAAEAAESAAKGAQLAAETAQAAAELAETGAQAAQTAAETAEANALTYEGQAEVQAGIAQDAASKASAYTASAYSSTTTYNYPDVVAYTDGYSYRCIGTSVLNDDPPSSANWVRLAVVYNDFFDIDGNGDLMPAESPTYSTDFELDSNGDIMPKE